MRDKLQQRASFRGAAQFARLAHEVSQALRTIRPASASRVSQAAVAIMHFVIHSDRRIRKQGGQWRLRRALLAALAAEAALRRMSDVSQHRIIISAALEAIEREIVLLKEELLDGPPA